MSDVSTSAITIPTKECIKATKVYDWVTLSIDEPRNVTIPGLLTDPLSPLAIINAAIALGTKLKVVGIIDSLTDVDVDVVSITRKTVTIDGVETPIGCLLLLKIVNLTITVFDVDNPLLPYELVTFTSLAYFYERAGVCFPAEFTSANIIPHVRSAEVIPLTPLPVGENKDQFTFQISICQDLQVETEVKLEVLGKFCTPRDNDIDCTLSCNQVTFPKQCPNIYPES